MSLQKVRNYAFFSFPGLTGESRKKQEVSRPQPNAVNLSEFHAYAVTPAKAGVQRSSRKLDYGFRRNDPRVSNHVKKS